jgi:hypothetical protein
MDSDETQKPEPMVTLPRDCLRKLFARCRREADELLVDRVSEEYQRGFDNGVEAVRKTHIVLAPLFARIAELEAQLGEAKTPEPEPPRTR